jgi:hypothetical protein
LRIIHRQMRVPVLPNPALQWIAIAPFSFRHTAKHKDNLISFTA